MSIAAMAWAKQVETGSPTRKLVLLALADYADQWGYCWPTKKTLGRECEIAERSVYRAINQLAKARLIRVVRFRRNDSDRCLYCLAGGAAARESLPPDHPASTLTDCQGGTLTQSQGHPDSGDATTLTQSQPNSKDSTVKNGKATPIPDPWEFGEAEWECWRKHGPGGGESIARHQFERFKAHHAAKGSRFKNWSQAWRTWCFRASEYAERDRSNGNQRGRDRWAI